MRCYQLSLASLDEPRVFQAGRYGVLVTVDDETLWGIVAQALAQGLTLEDITAFVVAYAAHHGVEW